MFSFQETSFLQLATEVRETRKDVIAETFYNCIDKFNLQQLAKLFDTLSEEIKPKSSPPTAYTSDPAPVQIERRIEEPHSFSPGILNLYFIALKRRLRNNELGLTLLELSTALKNLGELVQERNESIEELQQNIQSLRIYQLEMEVDKPADISLDDEDDEITIEISDLPFKEINQKIETQKLNHKKILAHYLEKVGDTSMLVQDCIKIMVTLLDEMCKGEAEVLEYPDAEVEEKSEYELLNLKNDDTKENIEYSAPISYPELPTYSDDEESDKDENKSALTYANIKKQIALNKARNQLLIANCDRPSAGPGPSAKNQSDETPDPDFGKSLENLGSPISSRQRIWIPLSVDLAENADFDNKALIIQRGLIEFAINNYVSYEVPLARISREILEEIEHIESSKNKYTYELFKKKILETIEHFLNQMISLGDENEKATTLSYLETISHLRFMPEDSADDRQKDEKKMSSETLAMFIAKIQETARRLHLTYKAEQTQAQIDQEKLAKAFIYNITEVDLEQADYEKNLKNIFNKFIKDFSNCDDTETEKIFNEILVNLPLPKAENPDHQQEPGTVISDISKYSQPSQSQASWWRPAFIPLSLFGYGQNNKALKKEKLKAQEGEKLRKTFSSLRI